MAVYNNVIVLNDDWYDINTLSGVAVGSAFQIQNISSANVYLREQVDKPSDDNGPILLGLNHGDACRASVSSGSLTMWAKIVGIQSKAILAIYD